MNRPTTAEERAVERPKVYIAGPISSNPLGHLRTGVETWHDLWDAGFNPYLPHLTCYLEVARHREYEEWMELDFAWMLMCDAVFRLPGHSPGADRETTLAKANGIPVFTDQGAMSNAFGMPSL